MYSGTVSVMDYWLQGYQHKKGRRSQISVRLPLGLHSALYKSAHMKRISMNELCVEILAEAVKRNLSRKETKIVPRTRPANRG